MYNFFDSYICKYIISPSLPLCMCVSLCVCVCARVRFSVFVVLNQNDIYMYRQSEKSTRLFKKMSVYFLLIGLRRFIFKFLI